MEAGSPEPFTDDAGVPSEEPLRSASGRLPRQGRGALQELPASAAREDPEDAAALLAHEGAVVVRGAVTSQATLRAARQHVEGALSAALGDAGEAGTAGGEGSGQAATAEQLEAESRWFGNVQARAHRRDLKLQLAAPVLAALRELLAAVGGCLGGIVTPDAELCELSALVADPGAAAQALHPDTQIAPGNDHAGLCTAFLALQDVDPSMGPTEVCPRSHGAAAHAALSADPRLGDAPRAADDWGPAQPALLSAGDVLLMDSRAWHRGGANTSQARRVLLYLTFRVPGNAPLGSTYSLLDEYQGRFRLSRVERWADSTAVAHA